MKAMSAANCSMLFMGIDSGDEDVRKQLYERPMKDELIYDKAKLIHDHGIRSFMSTIYGSPGETPEQMWKTLEMVDRTKPTQCSGNVFYPLPKTKLYDIAVELGQLTPEGEERIRRGESSFHQGSVLEHPHKDLAEMLAKVTPVYVKAPEWAKPWLRRMIDRKMKRTAQTLYAVLIPITFSTIGKEAVRITLASTRAAFRRRPNRSGSRSSPSQRARTGETVVFAASDPSSASAARSASSNGSERDGPQLTDVRRPGLDEDHDPSAGEQLTDSVPVVLRKR